MRTSRRRRTSRDLRRNSGKKDIEKLVAIARKQGWVVEKTRKGHWRFLPVDRNESPIIGSGTPGGGRSIENLRSQLRRAGLQINRRRTSRNPIPPQPGVRSGTKTLASRHFATWLERTYAPGTPVLFAQAHPAPGTDEPIPAGARGVVDGVQLDLDVYDNPDVATVYVRITDARHPDGLLVKELIGRTVPVDGLYFVAANKNMADWLVPLQDNWIGKPSKLSRSALPPSQRPRWKTWTPNPIPSRPPHLGRHLVEWMERTFAVGTPVRAMRELIGRSGISGRADRTIPAGVRAKVVAHEIYPKWLGVWIEIMDWREPSGLQVDDEVGYTYLITSPWESLEPLVDNWGPSTAPMQRYQLPRSQRVRSNRRRSQRRR